MTPLSGAVVVCGSLNMDVIVESARRPQAGETLLGAKVSFLPQAASAGWNAPALAPWLGASLAHASAAAFGAPPAYMGEGGSIPFMAMLGEKFPQAQFVVTGVLGPHSNAHGPNEFLHLPTGRRVTRVIAQVLADHAAREA